QTLIYVEAHVSQLQANVGVEVVGGDGVENLFVKFGAFASLVRIGDVFTEIVDADAHASAVHSLRGADCVGDFFAGYEAAGDAAAEGGAFGETAQETVLRESDEKRP